MIDWPKIIRCVFFSLRYSKVIRQQHRRQYLNHHTITTTNNNHHYHHHHRAAIINHHYHWRQQQIPKLRRRLVSCLFFLWNVAMKEKKGLYVWLKRLTFLSFLSWWISNFQNKMNDYGDLKWDYFEYFEIQCHFQL